MQYFGYVVEALSAIGSLAGIYQVLEMLQAKRKRKALRRK
jgi:hypothetical protein